MKVLFIGGNGNISWWCTQASLQLGYQVWHLNRGQRQGRFVSTDVHTVHADLWNIEQMDALVQQWKRQGLYFDCIADFMCFDESHARNRARWFSGLTSQYIFISSASAYQKPLMQTPITENTPLVNPYWEYSRNKIACEHYFKEQHQQGLLPCTIVRPSHTYDTFIPVSIGDHGYTLPARLKAGKPILVHDQGKGLWTLTHSSDFAQGFVALIGNSIALGEAYHITGDEVLTWNQIYGTIAQALGVSWTPCYVESKVIAQSRPQIGAGLLGDKAWNGVFDNSKIKSINPHFKTTVPFAQGILMTLQWFAEDSKRQSVDFELDAWMDEMRIKSAKVRDF